LHRQVDGENAFGMARYRELALTLRRIGRAILNWVRFGKYEHGLRALGPPSFALIELGTPHFFGSPSLQAFPFVPSIFRFPDPSIKGYGTLVSAW
jgi:hypothetical protein